MLLVGPEHGPVSSFMLSEQDQLSGLLRTSHGHRRVDQSLYANCVLWLGGGVCERPVNGFRHLGSWCRAFLLSGICGELDRGCGSGFRGLSGPASICLLVISLVEIGRASCR